MWAKNKLEAYQKEEKLHGGMMMTAAEFEDLKKADRIYNAIFHPDTKERVPFIFSMRGFTPVNIPIVFGLICAKQTTFNVIFSQWINQTYNAGWNYCNRNATSTFSSKELSMAYVGAVSSSILIGLGGQWLTRKYGAKTGSISWKRFQNGLVSLCALSTAGFINLFLIRYSEIHRGIMVYNKEKPYGKSKVAAKNAVITSALTRSLLPIPLTIVPALLWKMVEIAKLTPKSPKGIIGIDVIVTAISLTVALPLAIAIFKQELTLKNEKLEPQFHKLKDNKGNPIHEFTFNKGL